MARIVMKFGGTSVADLACIQNVAERVRQHYEAGYEIIVVVSAMSGITNQLIGYIDATSRVYDAREYDHIVASGEQVTSGLLALRLQEMGIPARSWLGWQIPIHTTNTHGKARITGIETKAVENRFREGLVAVVAGFQGLGPRERITTLGRGGSDTSAVALAAAFKAERCDIYTDVDGIYTTDPRIVPSAHKLARISHEEMLEMASLGAKVLQARSVELAMNHNVRLQVLSSFENKPGTLVVNEEEILEKKIVSGITCSRDEAKITVTRVADKPGIAAYIFGPLSEEAVNVDMIVQSVSPNGTSTDITFTVSRTDMNRTVDILERNKSVLGYDKILADNSIVKLSVVGVGMRSHAGVAQTMFATLAEKEINIQVIATSEIKISVLIAEEHTEPALRALHTAYGLDKP